MSHVFSSPSGSSSETQKLSSELHLALARTRALRRLGIAGLSSRLMGFGLAAAWLLSVAPDAAAQTTRANTLTFNGTTQFANVPSNSSLEFTTGTIEMWVKPNWTPGARGANPCLISERSGGSNGVTRFSIHMQDGMDKIGIWNVAGGYQVVNYNFTRGRWYHIAAVMTTSSTKFYVDGTLIGTTTNGINTSYSGLALKIGRSVAEVPTSTSAECFEGEMDEIKVWKTDRSSNIAADMATDGNATVTADLIAYYPVDNGVLGAANATAKALRNAGSVSANAATLYNYTFQGATPVITSVAPARNAVSVAQNASVAVAFSQVMNSATASDAAIKVFGSQTGKRSGAFAGGGTNRVSFAPTLNLKPGETAAVTVTTAARSADNITLDKPHVYQFTGKTAVAPGTFDGTQNVAVPGTGFTVAVGDIDGDGDLDMVTADYSNSIVVARTNDGAGNYSGTQSLTVGNLPYAVKLADIDGDGDLDLLTGNAVGTVSVCLNNAGTFSGPVNVYVNGGVRSLDVGDVDGDGDLDVVVSNFFSETEGRVSTLLNNGSGTFTLSPNTVSAGAGSWAIALGDIDGDGDLDVVTGNFRASTASVRLNDGTGTFSGSTELAVGAYVQHVALADIDGDGDLDLAATAGNTTTIYTNTGAGAFSFNANVTLGGYEAAAVLGDIDGDGDLDLVSVGNNGTASIRLNNGAGVFSGSREVAGVGNESRALALGDVDGDGDLDLLVRSSSAVAVRLNKVLAPTIASFTPDQGVEGDNVTITGTYFTGATSVTFNGRAATSFVVNSATQITARVPAGNTTGAIAVTTPNGTATSARSFTGLSDLVVDGSRYIFGTYRNVTIMGAGDAIMADNVNVTGTFTVQPGGKLNLKGNTITGNAFDLQDGATLTIASREGIAATGSTGSVQTTIRTFSADANYVYGSYQRGAVSGTGLPAQVRSLALVDVYGDDEAYLNLVNDVAIRQSLRVDYPLATQGKVVTLLSDKDGTALVVNNKGGIVDGAVTVQRYIDPVQNPGAGYRHFSAPVSNATVASLATASFSPVVNPAYNTATTPGLVTPYPTVFGYDHTRLATSPAVGYPEFDKGWFSPAAVSENLAVGAGYTVNLAANQTVNFVGTLNNGTVNVSLPPATNANDGWALVGNPYPAPLDWSQVNVPITLESALYVYESTSQYGGSYRSYINGVGNPLVAAGQAFFVRALPSDANTSLALGNEARVTDYNQQSTFQRPAETRPLAQLKLSRAGSPLTDEAYVYFQTEATAGLDVAYDARKIQHNSGGAPSLYSLAAGTEMAINALPLLTTSTVVPLGVQLPQAGVYTLEAAQLLNLTTATAYLRDNATGQEVNLSQQPRYKFTVTAGALSNDRFSLRFEPSRPLSTTNALAAASVSVYPNPAHNSFTLVLPAIPEAKQARITLLNSLGQPVREQQSALNAAGTQTTVNVAGLPAGVYVVRVQAGDGVITKRVVIK